MGSASTGIVQKPELVTAKAMLKIMNAASRFLLADLTREPPLYILLHTFIAREEGRHITISQLADMCTTTPSTTLRWVVRLEELGYVRRMDDPHDRRRCWVDISEDGGTRMACWLSSLDLSAVRTARP